MAKARKSNPRERYFVVPYQAYEEGSFVGMKAAIVRGRDVNKVLRAIDTETREGSFPPELVEAMETDAFGGSSVESAGDGLYYVPGDEEDSLYLVQYATSNIEALDTLDDAEEVALRRWRVYSPIIYAHDAKRGALRPIEKGSKKKNPRKGVRGKHIACGSEITAKECRQLQHVYESARGRGFSPERAAKQAWGSIENPDRRSQLMAQARAARKENGAGLGGFLGSLVGAIAGSALGVPFLTVLMSSAGGAIGAREAAPDDRKRRAAIGGGVGGVVGPLFAALGGWIAGKKPDTKRRNPEVVVRGRKRNPDENPQRLARRLSSGG